MIFKPVYPVITACVLCAPAAAGNDKLEEVVVSSSRIPVPLRQVGTSISVVTAADIQSLGFSSLQDILRTQPAVSVSNNGGAGKVSSLRIRGEDGYRTKVILDGIDISDTSAPQFSPRLEHLLSSGIERVEILRGPQGMLYGADAGGVINITTFTPHAGFAGELHAEGGRYGTRELAANLGLGGEALEGNLSVADYTTDGYNARSTDTAARDKDGYKNTTVHARLGWQPSQSLGFALAGHDVQGTSEYDGCFTADFAPTDNCSDEYRQRAWRGAADWTGERFTHELAYSDSRTERSNFAAGVESFANRGASEQWSYLGSVSVADALRLVYGLDRRTDSLRDGGDTRTRNQDGYYIEYQGSWVERLYMTAGMRRDDNEDFGSYDSWRLSGAWLIPARDGEIKLRGTWGTGFRAPSLYEIAYNTGPYAYPPAAGTRLDAEESEGYDLAVSWFGDDGRHLEAVYFNQRVDQRIDFDLIGYSGYLQQTGATSSSGIELVAEWPLGAALVLSGNYTYNKTEDPDGGQRPRVPEHMADLGLVWRGVEGRLRLGVYARLSRDAVEIDGAPLDDYQVVNLSASFTVLPGLDLYARVENLLDENYREVATYNTSGSAAYAGVRYTF